MASVLAPTTPILKAAPATTPPDPATLIDHSQMLYLLRCTDAAHEGTPDEIGIASRFLYTAFERGYLSVTEDVEDGVLFSLSGRGKVYMNAYGGSFRYGS